MSKLLTEQELQEQVEALFLKFEGVEPDKDTISTIMHVIKEQKQAHADMVIGQNEYPPINADTSDEDTIITLDTKYPIRNDLRAEQRERNVV